MERMWNPNEMLSAWARDDDVLSWRSLDTLRGVETDRYGTEPVAGAASDSGSDTSDADDLAEVFDRAATAIDMNKPLVSGSLQPAMEERRPLPMEQLPIFPHGGLQQSHGDFKTTRLLEREVDEKIRRLEGELNQRELPSTSEMVTIREPIPTPQLDESIDWRISRQLTTPPRGNQSPSQLMGYGGLAGSVGNDRGAVRGAEYASVAIDIPSNQFQRSPGPVETSRRGSMTLGDLLTKRKTDILTAAIPSPSYVPSPQPSAVDASVSLMELRSLEDRNHELQNKERHLQTVLAKQLVQIETLAEQLLQKDGQLQVQVLELSGLKEQITRLEKQNATLLTSIREKEQAQDQCTQLLVHKTNELSTMETKLRSVQITNETFQEQARKAIEDKEKTHKDYQQVVYDLGKLQKQMNAAAKDTVNVAEKDLLLREIDQLRHEKDQFASKLKDAEARKLSLQQSNSVVEIQRQKELQARVRELEEELYRVRSTCQGNGSSQLCASASFGSISQESAGRLPAQQQHFERPFQAFQTPLPLTQSMDVQRSGQGGMPSLLHGMNPSYSSVAPNQERPMTLRDMMGDRRPPPAPSSGMSTSNAGSTMSLASLGFSSQDRRSSGSGSTAFDFEQFKANALARRSTSIGDLMRQSSGSSDPYDPPPPSVNPALSAPFATEKQTLLQDSLQKRDLEQKLLKYHVEKEQTEAKLAKVEQSGLKTMSARTEKTWLENRLRDLTAEISRLKLSLR